MQLQTALFIVILVTLKSDVNHMLHQGHHHPCNEKSWAFT